MTALESDQMMDHDSVLQTVKYFEFPTARGLDLHLGRLLDLCLDRLMDHDLALRMVEYLDQLTAFELYQLTARDLALQMVEYLDWPKALGLDLNHPQSQVMSR